jgi:cytochrome b561
MGRVGSAHYNAVAKTLHWLIALGIIGMLALGWIMGSVPNGPLKFSLFQWHKSIGITILLLSLIRLGWRLIHTAPPLPADMPRWEVIAAKTTHVLFYILIIVMPLTGWIIVSASPLGLPTILYGVIPWPHLPILPTLENKKQIGHFFGDVHGFLAYIIAGLLVLHIGAAWKHHLINRDDVLLRMAPRFLHPALNAIRRWL